MNTFNIIVLICGGLMTITNFILLVVSLVGKAKSPYKVLVDRIEALEKGKEEHTRLLNNDKKKLDMLEEGNRVTQKALLALLAHGIDGNSVSAMTEARDELQKYLINR